MIQIGISELDTRAREIFRGVVEAYLDTGDPVGSKTVSLLPGMTLSSASIRAVLHDLADLGLLTAPHSSAGRVPTDLGLRLFVDGLLQTGALTADERAHIDQQCRTQGHSLEETLGRATLALSGLSSCAGVVLAPKADVAIRQVDFVPLSPHRALAILVGQDGSVENRTLELPPGLPASALVQAANYMNTRLCGLTLDQARARLLQEQQQQQHELDLLSQDLVTRGIAVWSTDEAQRPVLIVRGQAHLLTEDPAAADLDRVRRLLDDMERQSELAHIFELARDGDAVRIFIGSENKLFSLSGSSVIAAPYRNTNDQVVGVIGVIGPTRLNYARVIPMVDYTARMLSRLIAS